MGNKLTGVQDSGDLTDRRKELVFVEGYNVTAGVTVFGADHNNKETDEAVFGADKNITGQATVSSNITITQLEANEKYNGFMRLIHNMRPSNNPLNTPVKYAPSNTVPVDVLVMRKNNADTKIVGSRLHTDMAVTPAPPEGAPDDKARRSYTGKGSPVEEFDGILLCDRITDGGSLRNTPTEIVPPAASQVYAAHIVMWKFPGGDLSSMDAEREPIKTVTPNMIDSDGTVTWANMTAEVSLDGPTHALIYYLGSGLSGTPETTADLNPQGARGDPET